MRQSWIAADNHLYTKLKNIKLEFSNSKNKVRNDYYFYFKIINSNNKIIFVSCQIQFELIIKNWVLFNSIRNHNN